MRDWGQYSKGQILNGTDENGNRLVIEFAKDYKTLTGGTFCIGCSRKFQFQYNKLLNYYGMKNNTTEYILHGKYNGLTLPGWRNRALSNYRMTEEKALHFIVNHARGKELFKRLPKDIDERIEAFKTGEKEPETTDKFNVHTAKKVELLAYATDNSIDLGEASSVNDIRPVVKSWIDSNE